MSPGDSVVGRSQRPSPAASVGSGFSRVYLFCLRGLAAAVVTAGVLELILVAGNGILLLGELSGPLGLIGIVTIHMARFLNSMVLVPLNDPIIFWTRSEWMIRTAGSSREYFVGMTAAHVCLGMLNILIGYGLWLRRPRARTALLWLMLIAGDLAAFHGAVLLFGGPAWKTYGLIALPLAVLVALPIIVFLMLPGTAALFHDHGPEPRIAHGRRPWWLLSMQFLAGLLVLALGIGVLLLWQLGPLVEVAWAGTHIVVGWTL